LLQNVRGAGKLKKFVNAINICSSLCGSSTIRIRPQRHRLVPVDGESDNAMGCPDLDQTTQGFAKKNMLICKKLDLP